MSASVVLCICQLCSKEFTTKAAWYKKGAGKFCSRECAVKGRVKKPKLEVILKCKNCNKDFSVKKYRENSAIACSNECRKFLWSNSPDRKGDRHPNWKGGISSERDKVKISKEYKEWRESVYKKDNYVCQKCNHSEGKTLQAHHILNYSEYPNLRFDVTNGITLCTNCHNPAIKGSFHYIYGTRKNTKEQIEQFINKKL
jgi:hypothetical protein